MSLLRRGALSVRETPEAEKQGGHGCQNMASVMLSGAAVL